MSEKSGPDQRQIGKGESNIERAMVRSAGDQPVVGPKGLSDQSSFRASARTSPVPAKSEAASAKASSLEIKLRPRSQRSPAYWSHPAIMECDRATTTKAIAAWGIAASKSRKHNRKGHRPFPAIRMCPGKALRG